MNSDITAIEEHICTRIKKYIISPSLLAEIPPEKKNGWKIILPLQQQRVCDMASRADSSAMVSDEAKELNLQKLYCLAVTQIPHSCRR